LIFNEDTEATLTFADGGTVTVDKYSPTPMRVRLTEVSEGPAGPQAMPALLPPTSGYTYAIDFSAEYPRDGSNHEIANGVAEMLLQFDWSDDREICRIIFDESMKRAFRFPKHFGIELLLVLSRLEHKVFWLDIQSLREMLEESLSQEGDGLIDLNQGVYGELCSKVLAPLEEPGRDGLCNARVFRRLKSNDGRVGVECVCSDGQVCRCEGESLSFRGIYSKDCRRAVGEKLAMNVIPIEQFDRKFAVKASVAPLHTYESASQGPGRGAFFEDAEPSTVKGLYDYVSTNK